MTTCKKRSSKTSSERECLRRPPAWRPPACTRKLRPSYAFRGCGGVFLWALCTFSAATGTSAFPFPFSSAFRWSTRFPGAFRRPAQCTSSGQSISSPPFPSPPFPSHLYIHPYSIFHPYTNPCFTFHPYFNSSLYNSLPFPCLCYPAPYLCPLRLFYPLILLGETTLKELILRGLTARTGPLSYCLEPT